MALTVFCPFQDVHGPCPQPVKCAGQWMCEHYSKMMSDSKERDEKQMETLRDDISRQ